MSWIVVVPYTHDGKTELRKIETDVKDASNAIPQAKQRNQDHGFDWEQAQVKEI
jgi:hypothetical protein